MNLLTASGAKGMEDLRKMNKLKEKKSFSADPRKVSAPAGVPERKVAKRYVLTVLKNGVYEPMTNDEMNQFERQFPEIAKFWLEPQTLDNL